MIFNNLGGQGPGHLDEPPAAGLQGGLCYRDNIDLDAKVFTCTCAHVYIFTCIRYAYIYTYIYIIHTYLEDTGAGCIFSVLLLFWHFFCWGGPIEGNEGRKEGMPGGRKEGEKKEAERKEER